MLWLWSGVTPAFANHPAHPGHEAAGHEAAGHGAAAPVGDAPVGHASVGHASEGAGHDDEYALHPDQIAFGFINLAIFIVLLYVLARKPIAAAVASRAAAIRSGLDEAARVQGDAKARFEAVERKLASLDTELEEMRVDARSDADREGRLLESRAEAEANRVRESAERAIREETARARAEIREEAVALAMQLARATLTRATTPADQERLAREFLAAVDAEKTARSTGASK
ncbi:MAG: hypothetical protein EXR69_10925 [Myxococcales bacterium]|nr:hypothetical protein [Myxococcales bacterium]